MIQSSRALTALGGLFIGLAHAQPVAGQITLRTIDSGSSVGSYTSITTSSGRLAISYRDASNADLKLWYDDGRGGGTAGDGIANGSELRTLDSVGNVGDYTSITDMGGQLAISYSDGPNADLKLWYDDGRGGGAAGDGVANGTELRIIDSSAPPGYATTITTLNSRLAISYYDAFNANLKLWYDDGLGGGTAGDGVANGAEIRTIASAGAVGSDRSITTLNSRLAISFYDVTNADLKLWYDDGLGGGTAGDGVANGAEVRTINSSGSVGAYASITTLSSRLAIAHHDGSNYDLKLWYDDGSGGGTAGDGAANGSEIRTIDSAGAVGYFTSIVPYSGRLALSSWDGTNSDLELWYDDGSGGGTTGDGAANGTETRTIESGGLVGEYTSITLLGSQLAISYHDRTNSDLKLALITFGAVPNAPSGLGPAAYVTGSSGTERSPTLQFTQSDSDAVNVLAYRIQIDDTSDFLSPAVDYTSAALTQGAASFTVGQAAGAGSYTAGAAGQELSLASYYWRVRSNDGTADGAWSTANGGAVAFVTTQPTVDFSTAAYSRGESDGPIGITVNLSFVSAEPITVNYASSAGTAVAGVDYTNVSGTLSFTPGDISESFSVSPINDTIDDGDRTVTLTLSGAVNAVVGAIHNPATLTIFDNDQAAEDEGPVGNTNDNDNTNANENEGDTEPGPVGDDVATTGITDETGSTHLEAGAVTGDVEGLPPQTPVQIETAAEGAAILTVGDAEAPLLVATLEGLGAGGSLRAAWDADGRIVLTATAASGLTVTLELVHPPAAPRVWIRLGADEIMVIEVATEEEDATPLVRLQTALPDGDVRFSLDYDPSMPAARAAAAAPAPHHSQLVGGTVNISAEGLDFGRAATVSMGYPESLDGIAADQLRIMLQDPQTGDYATAGARDQGVASPSGVPGDYGVDVEAGEVWTETTVLGSFAIGVTEAGSLVEVDEAPPVDETGSNGTSDGVIAGPGATPARSRGMCGFGASSAAGLIVLGMALLPRRPKREPV